MFRFVLVWLQPPPSTSHVPSEQTERSAMLEELEAAHVLDKAAEHAIFG